MPGFNVMTVPKPLVASKRPRLGPGGWGCLRLASLWILALLLGGAVVGQLPFAAIADAVGTLAAQQWLAWLAANLVVIAAGVGRWQLLHKVLDARVGFGGLLKIRQAGQTVSFITPGPQFGGEPLQIVWLWRQGVALPAAALALALDRCFELAVNLAVLLLAVALLAFLPAIAAVDWTAILASLVGGIVAAWVLAVSLARHPKPLSNWMKGLAQRWQRHRYLRDLPCHGFPMYVARLRVNLSKTILTALLLSLAGWCGLLAELWLLLSVAGGPPDFPQFLLVLVAMRLAFLLPLPGGVGSLEAALFWAFQSLHAAPETAIGLIALMRLRDAVLLLAGFACLGALGAARSARWQTATKTELL
jgi:uncharacterized protein (TIRG00374 family)